MHWFIQNGSTFSLTDQSALQVFDKLPVGNFIIQKDANGSFYLDMVDSFTNVDRIYGNLIKSRDRILSTFNDRPSSTGVMLSGEKGSGKTLLARLLSIGGYCTNMPTIIINAPWSGDAFNKFLQDITQPCIILFDEFEKVYDRDEQESILTLLDGVFPSKKLFVFTCNDKWRIDNHMRNRPGRIYYMIDFTGIDPEMVVDYCKERLINKSHIDAIVKLTNIFTDFNFDMLKALVEEMNRYDETPQQALQMLNIKPEFGSTNSYKVTFKSAKFKKIVAESMSPEVWDGNPLNHNGINVEFCTETADSDSWHTVTFDINSLAKVDPTRGEFVFVQDDGEIKLTRIHKDPFDFTRLV